MRRRYAGEPRQFDGRLALAACLARGRAPLIFVAFNLFANQGACLTTRRAAKQADREPRTGFRAFYPAACGPDSSCGGRAGNAEV